MQQQEWWRGVINAILYQVQFEPELDDELALRTAQAITNEPVLQLTIQDNANAIRDALDSTARLTQLIDSAGSERDVRRFLEKVAAELENLKPWPVLPFRSLDKSTFQSFADTRPVARIGLDYKDLEVRLYRLFLPVDGKAVLVLELFSGDVVAIVDPRWIPLHISEGRSESLLYTTGSRSTGDVLTAFRAATGLTDEEVQLLPGSP